jgi:hypothetical protein
MKADKDPTYIMLTEAAKQELAEKGKFFKHDVIVKAGFEAFENKIAGLVQWPIVRDNVARESGALVGIAADNDSGWDPEIHAEKFLPGGRRKTIGYALASTFPRVAMEALRRQVAQAGGMCKSIDAKVLSFQKQGLAITYTPASAPQLVLPHVAAAE